MRKFVSIILCALWIGSEAFGQGQFRIYWGDLHGHSALSDGKGTPEEYFYYARDVAKLDFVILTDHDFGNGRPEWRMPKENWTLIQDQADQLNANGRFIAIAGYEWTSQEKYWSGFTNAASERLFPGAPKHYNHKNVYFPSRVDYLFSAKEPAYISPDQLAEAVREHDGLIHNNHPDSGEAGKDQFDYTPSHAAVIANTEMYPDTILYKGKSFPMRGEQTIRVFLNRGGRTGFVAGTDTHEGKADARTAVLASELTRAAIFDALRHRRNYAVNHARIGLDFRINGHFMGEEIDSVGKLRIMVDSIFALFVSADSPRVVHREDEDFAIADFARAGSSDDCFDCRFDLSLGQNDFDFYFRQKVHSVFAAAINFLVTFLAAKAFHLAHGHALDSDFVQRFLHLIQLKWFDDGFDLFHIR